MTKGQSAVFTAGASGDGPLVYQWFKDGVAIAGASMLSLVSAMLPGDAAGHMQAFPAAQAEGLAYLSINLYRTGFVTAQLFFGTWLFPLGYLVYTPRGLAFIMRQVNGELGVGVGIDRRDKHRLPVADLRLLIRCAVARVRLTQIIALKGEVRRDADIRQKHF